MATVAISVGFTAESLAVIDRWEGSAERLNVELGRGLLEVLVDIENHIKATKFTGDRGPGGGQLPIGSRGDGALRRAVTHAQTEPLAGYVGTSEGPTQPYARVILGPDVTVMRPKHAEYLWVPVADNLTPKGAARLTPRQAMGMLGPTGKRLLHVFRSKRGNLVAFLPTGGRYRRATKGGRQAGDLKGDLLFVLKDEVTVRGTDAFAVGVRERLPHAQAILAAAIGKAMQ